MRLYSGGRENPRIYNSVHLISQPQVLERIHLQKYKEILKSASIRINTPISS